MIKSKSLGALRALTLSWRAPWFLIKVHFPNILFKYEVTQANKYIDKLKYIKIPKYKNDKVLHGGRPRDEEPHVKKSARRKKDIDYILKVDLVRFTLRFADS